MILYFNDFNYTKMKYMYSVQLIQYDKLYSVTSFTHFQLPAIWQKALNVMNQKMEELLPGYKHVDTRKFY